MKINKLNLKRLLASRWVVYLIMIILLGFFWESSASSNQITRLLISSPSLIVKYFAERGSILMEATLITGLEALSGLVFATIFSFGTMIICLIWPSIMKYLIPIMVTSQVIPLIALAPFFVILLGIGIAPKIVMAALMCFFPIFVNFAQGFQSINPNVLELMHIYNAPLGFKIRKVYFPLSMSSIMAGLKISATLAVIGAIVAEFNGADVGLGKNLFLAAKRLEPELMMCSLLLSFLLGEILYWIIGGIEIWKGKWYLK